MITISKQYRNNKYGVSSYPHLFGDDTVEGGGAVEGASSLVLRGKGIRSTGSDSS